MKPNIKYDLKDLCIDGFIDISYKNKSKKSPKKWGTNEEEKNRGIFRA